MKIFNTTGPIDPQKHYFVSQRLNDGQIRRLIEEEKYFILHAPRQSGKTTAARILVEQINAEGKYQALYVNVEAAQAARGNFEKGLLAILRRFKAQIQLYWPNSPALKFFETVTAAEISANSFHECLEYMALHTPKPIILFIDEIDSLVGDTLISVLRQLRAGYVERPRAFPQSVCLIGVRDVRDYRIWSEEEQAVVLGGSAFNIKAESIKIPNFTLEQIRDLYGQHTKETGQVFTDEAIEHVFYLTDGQPWLVNALAYQACFYEQVTHNTTITKEIIEVAKEKLILRRDTHLDVLIDRLSEPRVRAIIDSLINGDQIGQNFPQDDILYAQDLGLISQHSKSLAIANPIYQEVIPRALAHSTQVGLPYETLWYVSNNKLDTKKLLTAFTQFFRENSAIWLERFDYKESGPHILLMAFLQRVINGGGRIQREYALGRKRVDLLILWPGDHPTQRIVIELKILHNNQTIPEGLVQTTQYMDVSNATEGHLVVFNRDTKKTWEEKIYQETHQIGSHTVNVWCM
ncbi:AAA family ATPase [Candidatus Woesearchaeota archaeon]|nr:AAA family ATPase [Candidatus Woesearchaeota archaeon]